MTHWLKIKWFRFIHIRSDWLYIRKLLHIRLNKISNTTFVNNKTSYITRCSSVHVKVFIQCWWYMAYTSFWSESFTTIHKNWNVFNGWSNGLIIIRRICRFNPKPNCNAAKGYIYVQHLKQYVDYIEQHFHGILRGLLVRNSCHFCSDGCISIWFSITASLHFCITASSTNSANPIVTCAKPGTLHYE